MISSDSKKCDDQTKRSHLAHRHIAGGAVADFLKCSGGPGNLNIYLLNSIRVIKKPP